MAEAGARCPVSVLDFALNGNGLGVVLVKRLLAGRNQERAVQGQVKAMSLLLDTNLRDTWPEGGGRRKDLRKADTGKFIVALDGLWVDLEHVSPTNHLTH